ncbi:hypothetical protein HMPREF9123_2734 [Neisseria bacilliformis ATCC BAA-1200]|uniref:Uncharacterized protein n=1 Tax=Neisseria bacilliformis ATCC BAA-1200 TaxID=888742 RepID=F2BG77_9NEIS|nr:hypothetical protein HMPREF9123_2734 [Neisseria bacilliformis ATCC BAA-1200]
MEKGRLKRRRRLVGAEKKRADYSRQCGCGILSERPSENGFSDGLDAFKTACRWPDNK